MNIFTIFSVFTLQNTKSSYLTVTEKTVEFLGSTHPTQYYFHVKTKFNIILLNKY